MGSACSALSVQPSIGHLLKRSSLERHMMSDTEIPKFKAGFLEEFEVEESVMGRGTEGTVHKCTERATGAVFAVKKVSTSRSREELEELYREVKIMRMLGRSLNTVHLHSAYRDGEYVYLVMEVCTGGTLMERMRNEGEGSYSTEKIAQVMLQVVRFVYHCHSKRVCYRDIKPQQFLYLDDRPEAPLKGTDFGISIYYPAGSPPLRVMVGTPGYMAPEVFTHGYGMPADMWSVGVMAYQLLTGRLPFSARQELGDAVDMRRITQAERMGYLIENIKRGEPEYDTEHWSSLPDMCLHFVQSLLNKDERRRLTARDAFKHPFLAQARRGSSIKRRASGGSSTSSSATGGDGTHRSGANGHLGAASGRRRASNDLGHSVLQRLQRFSAMSHFQQVMMVEISRSVGRDLPDAVREKHQRYMKAVRELFREMDASGANSVSVAELTTALRSSKYNVVESEVRNLVEAFDYTGTGRVGLEEFEVAMMDWKMVMKDVPKEVWAKAAEEKFEELRSLSTRNGSLDLTPEEVRSALPETLSPHAKEAVVRETMMAAGTPASTRTPGHGGGRPWADDGVGGESRARYVNGGGRGGGEGGAGGGAGVSGHGNGKGEGIDPDEAGRQNSEVMREFIEKEQFLKLVEPDGLESLHAYDPRISVMSGFSNDEFYGALHSVGGSTHGSLHFPSNAGHEPGVGSPGVSGGTTNRSADGDGAAAAAAAAAATGPGRARSSSLPRDVRLPSFTPVAEADEDNLHRRLREETGLEKLA